MKPTFIVQDKSCERSIPCFKGSKNNLDHDLDRDPEDAPVYIGHSLFNKTMLITLLLIVQSLLNHNSPIIWIKFIHIVFTWDETFGSKLRSR